MSIRPHTRLGIALTAGVGLGLLTPALPVFGQTSPAVTCHSAILGAQSQILGVQSQIVGIQSRFGNVIPIGVQSQLVSARSRLVALNSQVCQSLPPLPSPPTP